MYVCMCVCTCSKINAKCIIVSVNVCGVCVLRHFLVYVSEAVSMRARIGCVKYWLCVYVCMCVCVCLCVWASFMFVIDTEQNSSRGSFHNIIII